MNIPKSYEALAADLASEKILSKTLQGQKEAYMMLADKSRLDLSESKAREAALREELAALRESYEAMRDRKNSIVDLQQRLAVAEQRAGELEADKSRLDFIQENWVTIRCNVKNTGFCGPKGKEFEAYIYAAGANDKKPGEGETIRQSIDNMAETNMAALKPAEEVEALGTRPVGCCCPPKGHTGIWAAAMCPVHFGLKRPGVSHDQ